MGAHQCSPTATQSLQVIFTGKDVLLVANVEYLLILISKDGFSSL